MRNFSHLDKSGKAKMVDVGAKAVTKREAIAQSSVLIKAEVIKLIKSKKIPKGDVLTTAKLAGILAAKQTHNLIPMCHPLPLEHIDIDFKVGAKSIVIKTCVKTTAKTGVEMEALTAALVAALTVYDMCKSVGKGIVISNTKLLKKTGGKSGRYERR